MKNVKFEKQITMDNIIGTPVIYLDYLGCESNGKVVFAEPYSVDEGLAWLYIQDEKDEYNFHPLQIRHNITGQMQEIYYAELRLSNEVTIDRREYQPLMEEN